MLFINNCKLLYNSSSLSFFKIKAELVVSGKPPLLLMITADPRLAASKLVLPNGSSHLEQITEILTFFNKSKTYLLFLNPKFDNLS